MNRAFSAWSHLVRDERESLSFEEALEAESARMEQGYEFIWHYYHAGLYADATEAFLQAFPKVKILIFRDFIKDPVKYINEIYQFLDIPGEFSISETYHANESVITKRNFIGTLLFNKYKLPFYNRLKKLLSKAEPGIKSLVAKIETTKTYKLNIKPETYNSLLVTYLPDIERIEKILNRELPFWRKKME